jgi:hypothetical protein
MPNSSSIAAAKVTVATESHVAWFETLARLVSLSLNSGNTARKQRINRCCFSDIYIFRFMKQFWTAAAELSLFDRLRGDAQLGEEALYWSVPVGGQVVLKKLTLTFCNGSSKIFSSQSASIDFASALTSASMSETTKPT